MASRAMSSPRSGRIFFASRSLSSIARSTMSGCFAICVNTLESVDLDGTSPLKPQAALNAGQLSGVQWSIVTVPMVVLCR